MAQVRCRGTVGSAANPTATRRQLIRTLLNSIAGADMSAEIIYGTDFKAKAVEHYSSCAVNNAPALPVGPCDCGGYVPDTAPSEYSAPDQDSA